MGVKTRYHIRRRQMKCKRHRFEYYTTHETEAHFVDRFHCKKCGTISSWYDVKEKNMLEKKLEKEHKE